MSRAYPETSMIAHARQPLFVTLAFAAAVGSSQFAAGQGFKPTPRSMYQTIPVFQPTKPPVATTLPDGTLRVETFQLPTRALRPAFDLSDFLPTPQSQAFQDCVGWAVSRGCYSYQFGRSRQRKPAAPYDLFSPAFIYSQINEGQDSGSFIVHDCRPNAVRLITESGCASEVTMPYNSSPGAWRCQPSQRAFLEASDFRAIYHATLPDLAAIKHAITHMTPAILAVRYDDSFLAKADTGLYRWSGDQNSGFHVLCGVGYDDTRGAIRLMNSWGADWKDHGYCWVAYDQFNTIAENQWCYEAHFIRLLDGNPPRRVSTRSRTFLHDIDGSINAGPGFAQAVTTTADWLYVLRPNGSIFALDGAAWEDISSAPTPQGLGDQSVAMIASGNDYLFVLTRDQQVYTRIWGLPSQRYWLQLPTPGNQTAIDLRSRSRRVYAATSLGEIFRREAGTWWHD
jgi:hypothetical protein